MNSLDIESIVKKYSKSTMDKFNGFLMYRDEKIAKIANNNLEKVIKKELLPIIMLDCSEDSFRA